MHTSRIHCSEHILEIDMGDWEGAYRSLCYTPEVLQQIESDCLNFAPPRGESQKQVEERMMNFIYDVVIPSIPSGGIALIFGHGFAFKTVLRHILDSEPRQTRNIGLHNTGIIELGFIEDDVVHLRKDRTGWRILKVNDSSHLETLSK